MEIFLIDQFNLKWIQSAVVIVIAILCSQLIRVWSNNTLKKFNMKLQRRRIAVKSLSLILFLLALLIITGIWGLKRDELLLFISSVLTIIGVGFFAQWSILSNITSGLILFFYHPLKLGDRIHIVDKDHPMIGRVFDITYFFIHIKNEDGDVFTVPNTEILNKTIHINPKEDFAAEKQE